MDEDTAVVESRGRRGSVRECAGVCGKGQAVHSALVNVRVLRNESLAIKTTFVFVDTCTRHESIVVSNVPWVGKGQS